jgi:transcriptional regulator with XRE-family HTH domain/mannose-6-phosphate isomerase-like protein (cupin superfamily)
VAGVGAQLRSRRTAAGLSLRQFAKMLGVSASFISQIENGKSQPSVATLYQMCNALDITVDELFAASAGPSAAADDAADDAGDGAADGADRAAGQDEGDEAAGGAAGAAGRTTGGGSAAGGVTGGSGVTVTRAAGPQRGARRGSDLNAALATLNDAGPAHDGPVVTPGQRRRLVLDTGVTWEQLSSMHERAVDFMYVTYDVGGSSTSGELLTRHSGVEYGYVISGELEISLGFESYKLGPGDAISFDSSIPHRLDNVGSVPVKAIWVVHGRVRGHEH